ncbi:MAG: tetratricopeptide repeat protein [Candidatus Thorarchaeota archaeon]|nr:tetratricopeptide repeat protein [Candidatus Thorarchaeota archaeon]
MTEFKCRLCRTTVKFSLDDPSSYQTKTESGNPFIGRLFTVRVIHAAADEKTHVNVVVVDEHGEYRAHKDCYEQHSSLSGLVDDFEVVAAQLPQEIRPYLDLATPEDRHAIAKLGVRSEQTPRQWLKTLDRLRLTNPNSRLLEFLYAKWAFVTGSADLVLSIPATEKSWVCPLNLRLQARLSTQGTAERAKALDMSSEPELIQLEDAVAKADVYSRAGVMDALEDVYRTSAKRWGAQSSSITPKVASLFIQCFYALGLMRQGMLAAGLSLLEPVFTFAQIVDNREMIVVAGNAYASILRRTGDTRRALLVYEIALNAAEQLEDERSRVALLMNLAIVEHTQGMYETALEKQRRAYASQLVQSEPSMKLSIMTDMSESLCALERYEEAKEMILEGLAHSDIPTHIRVALLTNLKKIAGKTQSRELTTWIRHNLPTGDFLTSPHGVLFSHELDALEFEINQEWQGLVSNLDTQLELMAQYGMTESAGEVEFRAAEAYFLLYQKTHRQDHLVSCLRHLDLAKAIAMEGGYHGDLCRLSLMKGLVAAYSGAYDRARAHLEEAVGLARDHGLQSLEEQARAQLESLDSKRGTESTRLESVVRAMFKRLSFGKNEPPSTPKPAAIHALWIGDRKQSLSVFFTSRGEQSKTHQAYLNGVVDAWTSHADTTYIESFSGTMGDVIIEASRDCMGVIVCDRMNYTAGRTLQRILSELDRFPLRAIPEEAAGRVKILVSSSFEGLEEVNGG